MSTQLSQNKNITVNIPNIDSKIWNIEQKIGEMSKILNDHRMLKIILDNEGPDCGKLGLYAVLDNLVDIFKVPKENISIVTKNILEKHLEYKIIIDDDFPRTKFLDVTKFKQTSNIKNIKYIFGCLIGRANWPRLYLASQMHKKHAKDLFITYHFDSNNEYHTHHQGIEDLIKHVSDKQIIHDAFDFIKQCPILSDDERTVNNYPILASNTDAYRCNDYYHNFLIDIVCETYYTGDTFFPTEKTFRPILNRTPFIIQGAPGFIDQLKTLGFKTFEKWWPETYNNKEYLPKDVETYWSIFEILKIVELISKKTPLEIKSMYTEMQPTLEHNFNHLQYMYNKKIIKYVNKP